MNSAKRGSRIIASLSLMLWLTAAQAEAPPAAEVPLKDVAFEAESFRRLEAEAVQRFPELSAEDAARLVRENFRHLYANCIKEGRFLVKPADHRIADRAVELLALQRDLTQTLLRARRSLLTRSEPSGRRSASDKVLLMREAGRAGRRIRDLFRDHFLDMSGGSIRMTLGQKGDGAFSAFLVEAERINQLLSREMERYFLRGRPSVVAVEDYDRPSISVLGEALVRLAKASEERLRP